MTDNFMLMLFAEEWEDDEDPLSDEELDEYCEDSDTEDAGGDREE